MAQSPPDGEVFADQDAARLASVLDGQFRLEREIGRGGMGVVYLAHDLKLDRPVAIKLLPTALARDPSVRERFLREARTSARLSHPGIVPIFRADEALGIAFFVMAYVQGESLAEHIRGGEKLVPTEAARILREVSQALAYAHVHGVVHRDVKPENILLERGSGRVMVTDFGIARVSEERGTSLTQTGAVMGTVYYMSPEQAAGEPVDGRSDLYAVGVLGYRLLTGRLPFEGAASAVIVAHVTRKAKPMRDLAPDAPEWLVNVVDRCLSKEPMDRYADGDALASAISSGAAGSRSSRSVERIERRSQAQYLEEFLREADAHQVLKRAAELESAKSESGVTDVNATAAQAARSAAKRTPGDGYRLRDLRDAAMEAGISERYVMRALEEVRGGGISAARSSSPARATIANRSGAASALAGAPTFLSYEVVVEGQVSPDDYDLLVDTMRRELGDAGLPSVLGRTLTWTTAGTGNRGRARQAHVTVLTSQGRTTIRAEERLRHVAGGLFGGIMGGVGGGFGGASIGIAFGITHSGLLAAAAPLSIVALAYGIARTIYTRTVRSHETELRNVVEKLAAQVKELSRDGRANAG